MKELVDAGADIKACDDDSMVAADIVKDVHAKDTKVLKKTLRALGL
jgi:hypothetical protein